MMVNLVKLYWTTQRVQNAHLLFLQKILCFQLARMLKTIQITAGTKQCVNSCRAMQKRTRQTLHAQDTLAERFGLLVVLRPLKDIYACGLWALVGASSSAVWSPASSASTTAGGLAR